MKSHLEVDKIISLGRGGLGDHFLPFLKTTRRDSDSTDSRRNVKVDVPGDLRSISQASGSKLRYDLCLTS